MNERKIKYWVSLLAEERPHLDAYSAKVIMSTHLVEMSPEEKVDLEMLLTKVSVTINFLVDEAFAEPKKKRFFRK